VERGGGAKSGGLDTMSRTSVWKPALSGLLLFGAAPLGAWLPKKTGPVRENRFPTEQHVVKKIGYRPDRAGEMRRG
jgi:hypothetical protein